MVLMVKTIEVNGTFVDCLGVRREVLWEISRKTYGILMGNFGEMAGSPDFMGYFNKNIWEIGITFRSISDDFGMIGWYWDWGIMGELGLNWDIT